MILGVEGLSVHYGAVAAVKDVSFELRKGECLAILGANGAGKTSCVESIACLVPKTAGRVLLDGVDISRESASTIARLGLALVPQWRDLFPNFSVEETLVAAKTAAKGREPISDSHIYDLFPPLAARRSSLAGNLSGGEQQMLAIGRALVTRPKVLILDEPSAGLASVILNVLYSVIARIRQEGVSLLLVEQNLELASKTADRCLVLSVGRLNWEGPIQTAIHDEAIRRAYFE